MRFLIGLIPPLFIGGVLATAAAAAPSTNTNTIGKSYNLYHRLGNESKITSRGTIKIAPSEDDADGGHLVATFEPDGSARLDSVAFDSMVEDGALYTIVVLESGGGRYDDASKTLPSVTSYPPSSNDARYVSASVPGCSLRRSNLREEIGLSVGPTGKLLGVSYRPMISPLAPKTCRTLKPLSEKLEAIFARRGEDEVDDGGGGGMPFKTTVSFDSHKPMMAIPTILPQQRPPPGLKWYRRNAKNNPNPLLGGSNVQREGGGGGGIPGIDDEPQTGFKSSFLYRYWYIILPLAIMGLFGGVEEEASQSGGGAAASGGGGAGASAAGAVAAGGTGQQARQRRGKRD